MSTQTKEDELHQYGEEAREELRKLAERGSEPGKVFQVHPADSSAHGDFPLDSLRDAARHLRRPFTPAAIKFKVQSNLGDKGALIVSYIDARLVVERLNLVVPHLWYDEYQPLDGQHLLCKLTVGEISRRDVGQGQGKGAYSDALKRAAVKFGVGVSLYALPSIKVWQKDHPTWLEVRKQGQKTIMEITDVGDSALRRGYEKWLEEVGKQKFGEPLDHGDVEGAVGDPEGEDAAPEPEEDTPILEQLETEEAEARRELAREAYRVMKREGAAKGYPPGAFNQQLKEHGHSLEALDEFVKFLRAKVDARGEQ